MPKAGKISRVRGDYMPELFWFSITTSLQTVREPFNSYGFPPLLNKYKTDLLDFFLICINELCFFRIGQGIIMYRIVVGFA